MEESQIDYWSYSSMSALLSNPLNFKKQYVLKVYDGLKNPSGVVGNAAHKAIEAFYDSGKTVEEAIGVGYDYIEGISNMEINYGKTGSREKILKDYKQAIGFFFEEQPSFHEILGVETTIVSEINTVDGENLGLPAKAKIDLITKNKLGEIEVIDWKFVSKGYTDGSIESFPKFLQGMFDYHLVKEKYGQAPARVIFKECKISKNADGTPQIQDYVIDFKDQTLYGDFATFYKLYKDCTRYVSSKGSIYLPNPNDMFNGQNSFESFRLGIIGTDAPVSVKHKAEQKKFVEKHYVASGFDEAQASNYSDEEKIRLKLQEFGLPVDMDTTHFGASVTQFTLKPSRGIPMAKIKNKSSDLALALGAESVRIEAPIRGTNLVGVEIPASNRKVLPLDDSILLKGTTKIPIGQDVFGKNHYKDLVDMPHLLIAGATGSGKSVMLNVILTALTKQMSPEALRLVLIDPKQVELAMFADEPHVDGKVITDIKEAVFKVDEIVQEMNRRYGLLAKAKKRTLEDYNAKSKNPLAKIVVVIDEFADLMMSDIAPSTETMDIKLFNSNLLGILASSPTGKLTQKATKEALKITIAESAPPSVEDSIIRIAQKARAVGIHLILATQRPSADVVTGLIKANIPTKIAFATTSEVNSRIILDETGAEELTGKGDMLYLDPSNRDLKRLQGFYI